MRYGQALPRLLAGYGRRGLGALAIVGGLLGAAHPAQHHPVVDRAARCLAQDYGTGDDPGLCR